MPARTRDFIDRVGKNTKDGRDTRVRLAYHTHDMDPVCRGVLRFDGTADDATIYDDAEWDQTTYEGDAVAFTSGGSRRMGLDLPPGLINVTFSLYLSAPSTGAPYHPTFDSIRFKVDHAEGAFDPSSWGNVYPPWGADVQTFTFVWSGTFRSGGADSVVFDFEGYDFSGTMTQIDMDDGTVANVAIHYCKVAD